MCVLVQKPLWCTHRKIVSTQKNDILSCLRNILLFLGDVVANMRKPTLTGLNKICMHFLKIKKANISGLTELNK